MSKAFVLDTKKRPLDPIHSAQARQLLRSKKAAIYRQFPFTIILKESRSDSPISPLRLKIDPGAKFTGMALVNDANGEVVFAAELKHRGFAIRDALTSRRQLRRSRRARKTRYRQPRFLNRTRPERWLAPSLQSRIENIKTWVERLRKLAPIEAISQELVRFNMQLMTNPDIQGKEYQRGSNSITNLTLSCEKCNTKKGTKDIKYFLKKDPLKLEKILKQAKRPLADAAAVNTTRTALLEVLKATGLPVETGSGGLTKFNRSEQNLEKTHWIDAACVGKSTPILNIKGVKPLLITANGHGSRQSCRTDKYGFPSRHVPREKIHFGFQTGDIAKAVVTAGKKIGTYVGKVAIRSTGSFNISTKNGLIQGRSHKFCKRIHAKDGYSYAQ
ncbi:RNA-guided endonuclease IscB [Dolichospermum flos-aquae]|uniref:RRXRR domain-containing protein n=1 Tax=Dolichospermum flos-aquae LEGE 04289 TaxID=1828708 RepID=A0ACC5PYB1_DOLFA|nr:RNA-guided endonuclease IscB [Dolichospermum flos-aquae]MBE9217604.1 RRXRR domain-containing protein [Dolichospermum flos-aquae LEGE 04289]